MKKILSIGKRSAFKFQKEFPGASHEDNMGNQSQVTGIKSFMNSGFSKFNEDIKNFSIENIDRIWNRKEIFFVVDWQITDSL